MRIPLQDLHRRTIVCGTIVNDDVLDMEIVLLQNAFDELVQILRPIEYGRNYRHQRLLTNGSHRYDCFVVETTNALFTTSSANGCAKFQAERPDHGLLPPELLSQPQKPKGPTRPVR